MSKTHTSQWWPGDPVPAGEPRRYLSRAGYVRLRWRVGTEEWVEVLEHRFLMGAVPGEHVHHINGDKSDNRLENLEVLSPKDHIRLHLAKYDPAEFAFLYGLGLSSAEIGERFGCSGSRVCKVLRASGVERRSLSEAVTMSWRKRR